MLWILGILGLSGILMLISDRIVQNFQLRAMVRRIAKEERARREMYELECLHCLYGKVWRPEVISGEIDVADVNQTLFSDCQKCKGLGYTLKEAP
jgi:hypothetical protein